MIVERITLDRIARKRRNFWLPFFIVLAALYIAFFGAFIFGLIYHGEASFQKTLTGDIDQYGFIMVTRDEEELKPVSDFYEAILNDDEIEALGYYNYHTGAWLEYASDLKDDDNICRKIAERQMAAGITENSSIRNLMVNTGAVKLCNLNLQKCLTEEEKKELASQAENPVWFYLGSNYADIPLGSSFTFGVETYYLAGILEKGSNFIVSDVLLQTEGLPTGYTVSMDDYMVILTDEADFSNVWYYCVSDNAALETVEEKILAWSDLYGVSVMCGRSGDVFQNRETSMQSLQGLLRNFCTICVLTASIVMMCTQCIVILRQTKVLGILISNGMSKGELYVSFGLENTIKIFIPLLLAAGFSFLTVSMLGSSFGSSTEAVSYMRTVYGLYCIPVMLITAVVIDILSGIFPIIILKRAMPDRLMKGEL